MSKQSSNIKIKEMVNESYLCTCHWLNASLILLVSAMLCLSYLQMHSHLEQGSKKQTPAPLFCVGPISLLLSCSLPCFLSRLHPPASVPTPRPASDLVFPLSLSWLAGTPLQKTKSLSEKTQENTRVHTQVHACNHMQTHACAMGCQFISVSLSHTHTHTLAKTRTKR